MADQQSLTVQAVLDRFNESEATLTQLTEKLRNLALAEETANDAAATIRSVATAIDRVAGELRDLVEQAAAAQSDIRAAVEAARQFLAATDLAELNRTVQELADSSAKHAEAVLDHQQTTRDTITARLDNVEQQLEQSRANEAELRDQLDRVRSNLPPRKLRQFGLDA